MRASFFLKLAICVPFLLVFNLVKADINESELAQVLEKYRDISSLESRFTQVKKLVDTNIKLKSEGRLKLNSPDTIVWQIDKPSKLVVTMKSKEIQIVSGEGVDQTTQTFKHGENSTQEPFEKDLGALVTWLKFDPHALATEYQITKPSADTYAFEPKHSMIFRHIEMKLANTGYAKQVTLTENSGDVLDISFENTVVTHKKPPKAK